MRGWSVILALLAIVAGLLGFFVLASVAAWIAKILFFVFLGLLVVAVVIRAFRGQPVA